MKEGKEKLNKNMLKELDNLRQQVAEFGIMKRQYEWSAQRLSEEKEKAQNYLDIAAVIIVLIDKTGKVALINKKGAEILGYSQKNIIGKDWFNNFVAEEIKDQVKNVFLKVISGEKKFVEYYENEILTKKRERRIISWHNTAIKNDQGKIIGGLSSGEDITQRRIMEERLDKLNKCFLSFGIEPKKNINKLVALCGETLGATCALYNCLENEEMLCAVGQWHVPSDYKFIDKAKGHICYDVIKRNSNTLLHVRNLADTIYAKTDLNVKKYKLKTYLGVVVRLGGVSLGSLCVVYTNDFSPTEDDKNLIKIIASAIGIEEERKHTHEAEKQNLELYRALTKASPDGVAFVSLDRKFVMVNQQAAKLHGFINNEDMIGKSIFDFVSDQRKKEVKESFDKLQKTGEIITLEITFLRKDGSSFIGALSCSLLRGAKGSPKAFVATLRDITKQKKADEELSITKFVFDNMADAALWIDSNGQIFYVNSSACKSLGYSSQELLTMKIFSIDASFTSRNWSKRWEVMKKDKIGKTETNFINKEGKQFPVEVYGKYMKYDGQEYVCAIVRDITERWRIEGALRRAEEEKTGILDSLSEMVVYYGKDMRILWANKAAGASRDLNPVELVGKRCYDLWRKRKGFCENCPVAKVFKTGDYHEAEITLPDGKIWFARAHPIKDLEEDVSGVVEVISDITIKKKIEQEHRQSINKSHRILEETVIALAATAERRDPYTAGHQRRVARLACAIAKEMKLDNDKIEGIRMASIIHDVGKVYVPAEMLSKPSKLSELEFSIIKTHPQIGYDILKPVEFPWPIAMIVFQHHEKLDGSGYPKGIFGKDILIETKVLTVADVVEAMASYRPYRAALGIDKALSEIKKNRGILYDKKVVDACVNIFKKNKFKLE